MSRPRRSSSTPRSSRRSLTEQRLECSDAFYVSVGRRRGALCVASRSRLKNPVALVRGEKPRRSGSLHFVRDEGRFPYDLIGTTQPGLKLVSEPFRQALEEHRFTGWTTYPARILLGQGSDLEGYACLGVTGRCGPI